MPELELIKWAIEIGSFGLVAWIVMQTFTKTLPGLTEQFRVDLQLERKSAQQSLADITQALERLSVILLYHDATVRGKNPETLGSTEELLRRLRGNSPRSQS